MARTKTDAAKSDTPKTDTMAPIDAAGAEGEGNNSPVAATDGGASAEGATSAEPNLADIAAAEQAAEAEAVAKQAANDASEARALAELEAALQKMVTGKLIKVTGPEQGRWRGSFGTPRKFGPDPVMIPASDLLAEEIDELQADAELKVEIIDPV